MTKDKHPKELHWNKNNTLLNRNHLSQDIRGRGDSPPWNSYTDSHIELRMVDDDKGRCSCHHSATFCIQRDILFIYTQRLMTISFQLRIRDNHLSINARILKQKSYPKWRYVINNLHWHLSFKPPAGFFLPLDKYSITLSHLTRFL